MAALSRLERTVSPEAPPEVPAEMPLPYAATRSPVHGVEVLQQVLNMPVSSTRPAPEDLRDPTGPTRQCPSCAQTLEGADGLPFCYHCGASIT